MFKKFQTWFEIVLIIFNRDILGGATFNRISYQKLKKLFAQLAGAVEYTDCFFAEG